VTTTRTQPVTYPFNTTEGLDLDAAYAAAREAPGLIRVQLKYGEPGWLATRYADARMVLGDRRFSRAMAVGRDAPRAIPPLEEENLLSMDPPHHTRLRTLVAKAFTLRRVEAMRPRVRELAEGLVGEMIAHGAPADLVDLFALPLPVAVICELLGVPVEDRPKFRAWSDRLLSTARITPEEFMANREELRDYMRALIAERRVAPAEDLMSALIAARDEQDRLSELELVDLCVGVLVAGHETTASQLPNFVYVLRNEFPDKWDELRADLDLIPAAVEELMRYIPLGAGAAFARYALEDVEVGGELVRAGEPVLVAIGAANRDPLRFTDPDELRFDRTDNQHIGFGHGVHHCLGALLARLELQEALRVLLTRLPGLHIAGDLTWKSEMIMRAPKYMPVGW
jgi:cytochrome P450